MIKERDEFKYSSIFYWRARYRKKRFGFFSLTGTLMKNKYYGFFGFRLIKLNQLVFLKF
jgi:hypothetical protein